MQDTPAIIIAAAPAVWRAKPWGTGNLLFPVGTRQRGQADKRNLGDHSPAGYRQRARFYAISQVERLDCLQRVAE